MGAVKGYKQTPEHIAKRIKFGELSGNWKGDSITVRSGRSRAKALYPNIGPCVVCGNKKSERHHKDDNTLNNSPDNIDILCRKCHMNQDGRIDRFKGSGLQKAIVASSIKKKLKTTCHRGHILSKENVYLDKRGCRCCKECRKIYKKKYNNKKKNNG